MLIDTHAHINFNAFKEDADKIIQKTLEEDIWMVLVGTEYKTSKRALDYANKYDKGVYAAVGLHPIHLYETKAKDDDYEFITRSEEFNYGIYEKLGQFDKAVAIGEVGLDYYHLPPGEDVNIVKKRQQATFLQQIILARHLDKPVIIHCRQAHDDMLSLLKKFKKENYDLIPKNKPWGVMHCFSGDEDLAWQYFNLGLIVSFTGLITFSRQWDNLIRKLPNDKFMIETDSPFLTPEPFRGKRNEPSLVKYVAKRIAEIKNLSLERVSKITTNNARNFFGI